ncbi:hypothetical protein TKK_0014603 [Trichogramma kaykai]
MIFSGKSQCIHSNIVLVSSLDALGRVLYSTMTFFWKSLCFHKNIVPGGSLDALGRDLYSLTIFSWKSRFYRTEITWVCPLEALVWDADSTMTYSEKWRYFRMNIIVKTVTGSGKSQNSGCRQKSGHDLRSGGRAKQLRKRPERPLKFPETADGKNAQALEDTQVHDDPRPDKEVKYVIREVRGLVQRQPPTPPGSPSLRYPRRCRSPSSTPSALTDAAHAETIDSNGPAVQRPAPAAHQHPPAGATNDAAEEYISDTL